MTTAPSSSSVAGSAPRAAAADKDLTAPVGLQRRLFFPTTAAFAAVALLVAVLDVLGISVPAAVQAVPFALSVLLFGLPHGALDHLVPARLDPRISRRRSIATVVALYAGLGAVTAAAWIMQPIAGFAFFIVITWFHWGQGDLWLDRALSRTAPSRLDAVLTVLVRGGLPMLVPLIAHPDDYAAILNSTTALLDARAGNSVALLESFATRATATAVLAVAIAAHLLVRHRAGTRLRTVQVEIVVLVLFFAAVPPVLAVGLYFTFWHAVRHIVRLELLTDVGRTALRRGRLLQPFARFLLDALPITACAVALLAALSLLVHSASLGSYLLLIAALTTPHTAVVTWMDRRRSKNSSQKAEGDFALAVERATAPPDVRHTSRTSRD